MPSFRAAALVNMSKGISANANAFHNRLEQIFSETSSHECYRKGDPYLEIELNGYLSNAVEPP
jgi:hypothetical protein